ncbi:hypothetical protein KUTeg_011840 [Tegillarca granosa]|uniref:Kinesin motor domain-containing protein n=1 Tax=Tegillarca granosa TaxID=220873 RepID=A0ABQ9F309_TEGGR|nr:hypothetical protein KUTeg_011840 [Tegillarca granosa]
MNGNSTEIKDPADLSKEGRLFTFDFSYWSHDGFRERDDGYLEPETSQYADQVKVFNDLGVGVLENAWKGYNCSLFAYGQTGSGKSYSIVHVSILEIYNEQVRDLLNAKIESLITAPVNSYKEIDSKITEGTRNRTVASTNMNATSSRAHTIVGITFIQKAPNESGQSMTKTSVVNLVDLAGSERADSTGATGDRLKEGAAINQSLSNLGNVIKALADQSMGNKKVAALSPADINYEETLSTLRFDKLIRELREENARLMEMLKSGGISMQAAGAPSSDASEEMMRMQEELRKNQEEMENMKKSWEQRMRESELDNMEEKKKQEDRKVIPHFWNLNEDPSLTAMVVHFCKPVCVCVCVCVFTITSCFKFLYSIQQQHAEVTNKGGDVKLKPFDNAKIMLKAGTKVESPTYESAQEEIAERAGLMSKDGKSADDIILQEEVVEMLPMVNEANAIAEELNKKRKFELALISAQARGQKDGRTEVMVKMENTENGNYWMWDRNKFINRKFIMAEMYQNYLEEDDWDLPQDKDPFWEPADTEILLGTVHVHLMSLAHKLDIEENLNITNYKGEVQGHLDVQIIPVDSKGQTLGEDDFVDSPEELVGGELCFNFKINNARGLPQTIQKSFCKYNFYLDDKAEKTKEIDGTMNPDFNYCKLFKFKPVTSQKFKMSEYLQNEAVVIEVWGRQKDMGGGKGGGAVTGGTAATKQAPAKDKSNSSNSKPVVKDTSKKDTSPKKEVNQTKNGAVPAAAAASAASTQQLQQQQQQQQQIQQQQEQNKQLNNDLNTYKQRTNAAEGTLVEELGDIQSLIDQRLNSGSQTIDISELQAMLKGARTSGSGGKSSSGESKACIIQEKHFDRAWKQNGEKFKIITSILLITSSILYIYLIFSLSYNCTCKCTGFVHVYVLVLNMYMYWFCTCKYTDIVHYSTCRCTGILHENILEYYLYIKTTYDYSSNSHKLYLYSLNFCYLLNTCTSLNVIYKLLLMKLKSKFAETIQLLFKKTNNSIMFLIQTKFCICLLDGKTLPLKSLIYKIDSIHPTMKVKKKTCWCLSFLICLIIINENLKVQKSSYPETVFYKHIQIKRDLFREIRMIQIFVYYKSQYIYWFIFCFDLGFCNCSECSKSKMAEKIKNNKLYNSATSDYTKQAKKNF